MSSKNILLLESSGIEKQEFLGALGKAATQTNCQCTLTASGYRIYRPPNITYNSSDSSTKTMWGGLRLRFTSPPVIKGHTYVITFDIKGQTSVGISGETYWSYAMGSSVTTTGLMPAPTSISRVNIPADWQSTDWCPYFYKFTVTDDVYKICQSTSGSFTSGETYLSYRDWKFGFGYNDTGTLGTDLYIKNLGMYDITDFSNFSVNKKGQMLPLSMTEVDRPQASISKSGIIEGALLYEY